MFRLFVLVACLCAGLAVLVSAEEACQSDWSGGGGEYEPQSQWTTRFDSAENTSWRAIAGQICLSSSIPDQPTGHLIDDNGFRPTSIVAADIDGDGDLDVVASTLESTGLVYWWRNDGDAWTQFTICAAFAGVRSVCAADLNGDGRCDVAAVGFDNTVESWLNQGGEPVLWQQWQVASNFVGGHHIIALDFDEDGDQDLLGCAATAGDVTLWRNEGSDPPVWAERNIDPFFGGAASVDAADIDGDGLRDVLGAAYTSNDIAWWRNEGGDHQDWTKQTIDPAFAGAHYAVAADVDHDGAMDVVGCAYSARDVAWWRNAGGDPIVWEETTIADNFLGPASMQAADFDGDGDIDVMCAGQDPGLLAWWENLDGLGVEWEQHWIDNSYPGAWPTCTADMDADGDIDLLTGARYAGYMHWWDLVDFKDAGTLTSSILDLGESPGLAYLAWQAAEPAGTDVRFQFRSADDPEGLGDWSAELDGIGELDELGRYFQYRALLSGGGELSPILEEVTLRWGATSCLPLEPEWNLALYVSNPNHSSTTIHFATDLGGLVSLYIVDVTGRRVCSLIADERRLAGRHSLSWDGCDNNNRSVATGMYFVCLKAGGRMIARKITILK